MPEIGRLRMPCNFEHLGKSTSRVKIVLYLSGGSPYIKSMESNYRVNFGNGQATPEQLARVPKTIGTCEVSPSPRVMTFRGEEWITLYPEDNSDDRLWEYSLTSGRILQTQGPR